MHHHVVAVSVILIMVGTSITAAARHTKEKAHVNQAGAVEAPLVNLVDKIF